MAKKEQKNAIEEIYEEMGTTYTEGNHSSKDSRSGWDTVYVIILVGGLLAVGLVLLLLSVFVKAMADWTVGGVVFILFGILLFAIGSKVQK